MPHGGLLWVLAFPACCNVNGLYSLAWTCFLPKYVLLPTSCLGRCFLAATALAVVELFWYGSHCLCPQKHLFLREGKKYTCGCFSSLQRVRMSLRIFLLSAAEQTESSPAQLELLRPSHVQWAQVSALPPGQR